MARKKKVIEQPEIEEKKPSSSITYRGNVKITVKKNNKVVSKKVIHNEGTQQLFRALCMALCGDTNALTYMPRYLNAYSDGTVALRTPSPLTRRAVEFYDNAYIARFMTTITYGQLVNVDNKINQIALTYDSIGNNQLATLTLPQGEEIEVSSIAYTIIIEWSMLFQDANDTASTT